MYNFRRVILLIFIMFAVSVSVVSITIYILNQTSIEQERLVLWEIAESQSLLIESIYRKTGDAELALQIVKKANSEYDGIGITGEFTISKLEYSGDGEQIVFLVNRKKGIELKLPNRIPSAGNKFVEIEGMALRGNSGTTIGPDYRGVRVLAAYRPVKGPGWALVAKIDMDEISTPFKKASGVSVLVMLLLILPASMLFIGITNPMIQTIKESEERYRRLNEELEQHVAERTGQLEIANSALSRSEEKYRTVANFTYDLEYWLGTDGSCIYISPSCERITGYSSEKFIDKPLLFEQIIYDDDRGIIIDQLRNIADIEGDHTLEFRIVTRAGNIRWVVHRFHLMFSDSGELLGRRGSYGDITERKQAEEEIRRLSSEVMISQETERQRVAKDLHDGIGQIILAAKMNLNSFMDDPERNETCFDIGMKFIDQASQELREIYTNLYPSILSDLGLPATVRWYAKNYLEANDLDTEIKIDVIRKLPHEVEVNLYRIIQEIFSNIVKHANASLVKISLYEMDAMIGLDISDDGVGFSSDYSGCRSTGSGLINIRQRVKNLNGIVEIKSAVNLGTGITLLIPPG